MLMIYDKYELIEDIVGVSDSWNSPTPTGGYPYFEVWGVINEPQFIKGYGFKSDEKNKSYKLTSERSILYSYTTKYIEKYVFDKYSDTIAGVEAHKYKKYAYCRNYKGTLIKKNILAEDKTYPDNGEKDGYWWIKKGTANIPPIISGEDENLGNKYSPFSINYSIKDTDDIAFSVREDLDGMNLKTFKAKNDIEYSCNIPQNTFYSLPDGQHTVRIEVIDSAGNKIIRMYTFNKVYMPPIISGEDKNLGIKDSSFGIKYTIICDNPESNTFTVEEKLDDLVLKRFDAVKGVEYTVAVQDSSFYKLENGQHIITIRIIDNGKTVIRQYTFSKEEKSIELQLSKIIDTDRQSKNILLIPEWQGIQGNDIKVEVCNNAYDLSPKWEDATESVLNAKTYIFSNKTKTADKWGVNIRFKCNKKVDDSTILIKGFKADIII